MDYRDVAVVTVGAIGRHRAVKASSLSRVGHLGSWNNVERNGIPIGFRLFDKLLIRLAFSLTTCAKKVERAVIEVNAHSAGNAKVSPQAQVLGLIHLRWHLMEFSI